MIAEVALNVPLRSTFDYLLPAAQETAVSPGMRVIVPFGRRQLTGIVVGLKERSALPPERLKVIRRIPRQETVFSDELFRFTRWLAEYYVCGWGEVLNAALPCGLGARYRVVYRLGPSAAEGGALERLSAAMRGFLAAHPSWSEAQWRRSAQTPEEREWLARESDPGGAVEAVYEFDGAPPLREEKWLRLRPGAGRPAERRRDKPTRKAQVLQLLRDEGEVSLTQLGALMPSPNRIVNALAAEGHVEVFTRPTEIQAEAPELPPAEPFHTLTPDQEPVVEAIRGALGEGVYRPFLLEGVTGSGKTEVYLHAVREALRLGRTALVLVPEIALTAEILRRFRSRFGRDVAVLHSAMDDRRRLAEWMRARRGEAKVVIGARSAVFAPLANLGLLIVDEEHDGSYKQDETPRYHARDAALVRARENGAVVVLGTATPSMESLHNVTVGKLERLALPNRVANRALPEVELIDLRTARRRKGSALFSMDLVDALGETLRQGQQAILFLNRRGFAQLIRCEGCGEAILCPNCSLSLVYHRAAERLRCHHCEYAAPVPPVCPACGAAELAEFGLGTERIEQEVAKLFPTARILRMDSDSLRRRGALERMIAGIRRRDYDVIIGTQILAKGHDFPHITLVAAVLADVALNLPDFRAAERTFQILTQMAGRAGRGDHPGTVMIQTYKPDHHALVYVRDHNTARFAEAELAIREATQTPPFTHQVMIWVSSTAPDRAERLARQLNRRVRAERAEGVAVLGPAEAPIRKVNRRFRWMVLLRSTSVARMRRVLTRVLDDPEFKVNHPDRVVADVDPQSLL